MSQISKLLNDYLLNTRKQLGDHKESILKEIPDELLELVEEFLNIVEARLKLNEDTVLKDAYFQVHDFFRIAQMFDGRFVMYIEIVQSEVLIKLLCLDPSHLLKQMGKNFRSKVYFSATLSPIQYFKDMLGSNLDDLQVSLPSPFAYEQTDVFIYPLSTRYQDREKTKNQIAMMFSKLLMERPGNYLFFFPSYKYMNIVYELFVEGNSHVETILQTPNMSEEDREKYLSSFTGNRDKPFAGFAVMGGIFSEGIDLVGDRLNGVAVIGVGLPQIGLERNIIRDYFTGLGKNGYDYAYVYPGVNKVLQAGGRLIRSEQDSGTIILVDDRYLSKKYQQLLPESWRHFTIIN